MDTSPLARVGRIPFNGVDEIYIYYTVAVSLKICAEKNYKVRFLKGQNFTKWSTSEKLNALSIPSSPSLHTIPP
jgi:hypothetical protein